MPNQTTATKSAHAPTREVAAVNIVNGPLPDEKWPIEEDDARETPSAVEWSYWQDRDGAWVVECPVLGLSDVVQRPEEVVEAVLSLQQRFWQLMEPGVRARLGRQPNEVATLRGLPWRLKFVETAPHSSSRGSGRDRFGLLTSGRVASAGQDPAPLGALDDWEI